MAEIRSKQDLLAAGFGGYQGWSEQEALADYRATKGQGKYDATTPGVKAAQASSGYPSSSSSSDFATILAEAQRMLAQANQPAIAALEAQKPDIETRYQNLLKDITANTYKAKSAEYSRRGIPLSSGAYETDIATTTAPMVAKAGEARVQDIASLNQNIAQLQSGGNQNAISLAQNLYNQALALQQQQQEAMRPYTLSEGETVYDPTTGKAIYTAPKTYKYTNPTGTSGGNTTTPTEAKPLYSASYIGALSKGGEWKFTGTDWVPVKKTTSKTTSLTEDW